LDDLGLVSTRKPACSWVKPTMDMGAGMAKNTQGLPMQFTSNILDLNNPVNTRMKKKKNSPSSFLSPHGQLLPS